MNPEEPEKSMVQNPSLKLVKNSKGYTWEIKILRIDVDEIERINQDMLQRFGSVVNE